MTTQPTPAGLRQARIEVFEDTMAWLRENQELAAAAAFAAEHSQVFYEDDYPLFDQETVRQQRLQVMASRTFEAAMALHRLQPGSRIAVLNFANAFQPGGGVASGAGAQEECLCRCSTLYPAISSPAMMDAFYHYHRRLGRAKATDSLIYTRGVVICKTDEDLPRRMPRENWVSVDVITLAAPDLRPGPTPTPCLRATEPT